MNYKQLPQITNKQQEIINLVFKFRFINRKQIQTILNHKDAKRINVWLKDMVEKQYLGRIYSNKLLENTKPAIYYLKSNGILYVRYNMGGNYGADEDYEFEFKHIKKFYEDKNASETFINHSVTICDFYIQFKEYEKTKKNLTYEYATKTELMAQYQISDDLEEIREYLPDVHIERIKETEKEYNSKTFFLDLIDPHVPRYALRYKVKQYIKLFVSKDWEYRFDGSDSKFPGILIFLPNEKVQKFLSKYIQKELDDTYEDIDDMVFRLTTTHKALTIGVLKEIWEVITRE